MFSLWSCLEPLGLQCDAGTILFKCPLLFLNTGVWKEVKLAPYLTFYQSESPLLPLPSMPNCRFWPSTHFHSPQSLPPPHFVNYMFFPYSEIFYYHKPFNIFTLTWYMYCHIKLHLHAFPHRNMISHWFPCLLKSNVDHQKNILFWHVEV